MGTANQTLVYIMYAVLQLIGSQGLPLFRSRLPGGPWKKSFTKICLMERKLFKVQKHLAEQMATNLFVVITWGPVFCSMSLNYICRTPAVARLAFYTWKYLSVCKQCWKTLHMNFTLKGHAQHTKIMWFTSLFESYSLIFYFCTCVSLSTADVIWFQWSIN